MLHYMRSWGRGQGVRLLELWFAVVQLCNLMCLFFFSFVAVDVIAKVSASTSSETEMKRRQTDD